MIDWPALKAANAPLNAFLDWDEGASGGEGPLAGMTIGVKSNIAVKGLPWTAGMALYRDRIADCDAEVVARLRVAGAVILGSVNMEEAALGAKTDNPWFGATQNPHRLGYTPGGSSGGSGAAVAAGLCDAALGTDTMGSVRIPASYCGVYGFKPAPDAISQDGVELLMPDFDAVGPLACSLDTLEQVARIVSEFGEGSGASDVVTISGLGAVECHPAALAAFEQVRAVAREVPEIALDETLSRIRYAGFIATSRGFAADLEGVDPALISSQMQRRIAFGPGRKPDGWARDQEILATTRQQVRGIVERYGAILLPTAPQAAFPHSEDAPASQADFTCLANIARLPAISLPAGWTDDGLPVGVQLIGQTGAEAGLFALARRLDLALNAYRPPATFGY